MLTLSISVPNLSYTALLTVAFFDSRNLVPCYHCRRQAARVQVGYRLKPNQDMEKYETRIYTRTYED